MTATPKVQVRVQDWIFVRFWDRIETVVAAPERGFAVLHQLDLPVEERVRGQVWNRVFTRVFRSVQDRTFEESNR